MALSGSWFLVEHGADVSAKDEDKSTPLHLARTYIYIMITRHKVELIRIYIVITRNYLEGCNYQLDRR